MPLVVPAGPVRPTSDRVREAIFSSLGARVIDADILDLYAGTGGVGLEAASRGARSVVFVERARGSLSALESNIAKFHKGRSITAHMEIVRGDVPVMLSQLGREFTLIFSDPPYGEPVGPVLAAVECGRLLAEAGVFVFESAKRDAVEWPASWELAREAVYGDTRISYLKRTRRPARE